MTGCGFSKPKTLQCNVFLLLQSAHTSLVMAPALLSRTSEILDDFITCLDSLNIQQAKKGKPEHSWLRVQAGASRFQCLVKGTKSCVSPSSTSHRYAFAFHYPKSLRFRDMPPCVPKCRTTMQCFLEENKINDNVYPCSPLFPLSLFRQMSTTTALCRHSVFESNLPTYACILELHTTKQLLALADALFAVLCVVCVLRFPTSPSFQKQLYLNSMSEEQQQA